MFDKIKKLLGQKSADARISWSRHVEQFDLSEKPLTRALLTAAAREIEFSENWLRAQLGTFPTETPPEGLSDVIQTAAVTISSKITVEIAMTYVGRRIFLPGDKLPDDAPVFLAFEMLILFGIVCVLRDEGFKPDISKLYASAAESMFLMREAEEIKIQFRSAYNSVQKIVSSKEPTAIRFVENVCRAIPAYLSKEFLDDPRIQAADFSKIFGSLLESLVGAFEPKITPSSQ